MYRAVFIAAFIAFISAFSVETVFAQTPDGGAGGVSLEAEIQNIEREISRQGITPAQRHEALIRLARLRQLSGDIEGAAKNWLEAATAISGRVDDDALLSCAYCLAAMGEWDRAVKALEPLVNKMPRARFLDLSIRAIRTADTSALAAIADNPEFSEMKAEILFVLWKVSRSGTGEKWRQRLLAEFPQTPEGLLAAGASSSSIVIRPSPFWLFASGLDSLPLIAQPTPQPTPPTAPTPQPTPPPAPTPQPTPQQQQSQQRLQTGIFSREANAQAQAANLRNAGFNPTIERRMVNNTEMWAVTVPVGADPNATSRLLREAGFESFLVR